MSDIVDRAQPAVEGNLADAFALRAAKMFHEEPRSVNGKRVCLDCEEALSKKRLKAAPEAVRCVDCQKLHERKQGRPG